MKITYVGTGSAALFDLIKKAKAGHDVTALEKGPKVGGESSWATAAREPLGPHYSDEATIIKVQEESIQFERTLLEFLEDLTGITDQVKLAAMLEEFHLPTGCDYLLHRKSETSAEKLESLMATVVAHYEGLCKKDPKNKVFGEPAELVRKLSDDYVRLLAQTEDEKPLYTAGYHVRERFIRWPMVVEKLFIPLLKKYKVDVRLNQKVTSIQRPTNADGYVLTVESNETKATQESKIAEKSLLKSPTIANATCHFIATLNQSAGAPYVYEEAKQIMRPKVMAILSKVPSTIKYSRVVIHGPYAAITLAGDGTAFLTAEKVTTLPETKEIQIESQYLALARQPEKLKEIAAKALQEATNYFPELKADGVQVEGGKLGVVRTYEQGEHIDTRVATGVKKRFPGLWEVHATKLMTGASIPAYTDQLLAEDSRILAGVQGTVSAIKELVGKLGEDDPVLKVVKNKESASDILKKMSKDTVLEGMLWTNLQSRSSVPEKKSDQAKKTEEKGGVTLESKTMSNVMKAKAACHLLLPSSPLLLGGKKNKSLMEEKSIPHVAEPTVRNIF